MLPVILFAIGAFAAIGVITVTRLTWNFIINWFRNRTQLKNADKDNIAFTIQEKMQNKRYKTVQGIFNQRTNEVVDAQEVSSDKVDEQIKELHRDNELVIYE